MAASVSGSNWISAGMAYNLLAFLVMVECSCSSRTLNVVGKYLPSSGKSATP